MSYIGVSLAVSNSRPIFSGSGVEVTIKIWGASGAGGWTGGGNAGGGGILAFTLTLDAGTVIDLGVGGKGNRASGASSPGAGGTNGGGSGAGGNGGGGGGGRTEVRISGAGTDLAIAGGGAGGTNFGGNGGVYGAPQSGGAFAVAGEHGGNTGSKNGATGVGSTGGGGGGAEGGASNGTYTRGGTASLDTSSYSVARDTGIEATMTPMPGGSVGAPGTNGADGKIEIIDGAGTTTYSTPAAYGTYTHTIS
jgi:hypothetical protein